MRVFSRPAPGPDGCNAIALLRSAENGKESRMDVNITLIGGPTALIEAGGFRLLTDPVFDGPGEYPLPHVTLRKTSKPALSAEPIGEVDAVLLSHDQRAEQSRSCR